MDQQDALDGGAVIDQFSAREACTVLAALRMLQQICAIGGRTSSGLAIDEMEHFEDTTPLSVDEIDALCERIAINWPD